MTVRVMLVSPAMNSALREARFDGDAPLDRAGERSARAAAAAVPRSGAVLSGPSERCLGTAAALGLAARAEPALTGWDLGRWSGRRLDEVGAAEPDAVAAWIGAPSAAPHGGESLRALVERVGGWLDGTGGTDTLAAGDGPGATDRSDAGYAPGATDRSVLAVAEPAVVRAAVVHALALPVEAFWRLDVAPLVLTELSGRSGRWNVRLGRPLAAAEGP
ncbi:histidine phosphatase family protein [Streptomyces sp. SID5594]|uniref:histidine phosphatase family protein n=1 Tax=unclassified Streptomyces TaxID=2593676 RepID=UPI00047731B9|nr:MULTISPECIES: histidine phosphatase family protein [unclassified Streptomyces]MZF54229.1 histidine phosphatase family protein [Streptomyces sp. SID5594]